MSPAYSLNSQQGHEEGRARQMQPRKQVLGLNNKAGIASSLFGPDSDQSKTEEHRASGSTHTGVNRLDPRTINIPPTRTDKGLTYRAPVNTNS
eukprot:7672532-Ditylum_brightwellii.AAC.1